MRTNLMVLDLLLLKIVQRMGATCIRPHAGERDLLCGALL